MSLLNLLLELLDELKKVFGREWKDDPNNVGWAPGPIGKWKTAQTHILVKDAMPHDFVQVSNDIPDWGLNDPIMVSAKVIKPQTVQVILFNAGGDTYTPPPATWHARVMKR